MANRAHLRSFSERSERYFRSDCLLRSGAVVMGRGGGNDLDVDKRKINMAADTNMRHCRCSLKKAHSV